jgi:glycerol-3-phosphate dehydrogenase
VLEVENSIKAFEESFPGLSMEAGRDGNVVLSGSCRTWEEVVDAGHFAAKLEGVKHVASKLSVNGVPAPRKDYAPYRAQGLEKGKIAETDALVIGAGVTGCAVARELSKTGLKVIVVESLEDVCAGTSKCNNGNIHPGHSVTPGTLKAKLNVKGNSIYTQWAADLGFDLVRCGAMGAINDRRLMPGLMQAYGLAKKNGVPEAEIVDARRALEIEPGFARMGVEKQIVAAIWFPSMGLVEPYQVVLALAENAAQNGVQFMFETTVCGIETENGAVTGALTSKGLISAKYVINCAGLYADDITEMAGDPYFTIHPRKGVIAILDKERKPDFDSICEIYTIEYLKAKPKKNSESKGGGMCITPEGNVLMGPSATEIPDKEDLSTTPEDLEYAMGRGGVKYEDVIRFFAGNRAADYKEDFIIEMSKKVSGFVNVAAIQSPGLAAAPAIAEMAAGIVAEEASRRGEPVGANPSFNPKREKKVEFRKLSRSEQDELVKKDSRYGRVVCRCETITEGEILDTFDSPIPPRSIDAVKRRARAGMGRCQGGFCQIRVMELLAQFLGKDWTEITLKGEGSRILAEANRKGAL